MTKANDLASLLDANGDVVSSALDNVPAAPTPSLSSLGIPNHDDITVDGSHNVGIGTASPSRQLEIYDDGTNGQAVLAITAQNTENSRIMFADTDDNNIGILDYNHSDDSMRFNVNNSERLRIDSNGTIMTGKTVENTATDGIELNRNNVLVATRNNDAPLLLNRRSSDGELAVLRKDNTTVGSIGVSGGNNLYISGQAASHSGLTFATNQILPTAQGSITDGAESLGSSSNRFSDLYLSGGVYLGGTVGSIGTNGGRPFFKNPTYGGLKVGTGYSVDPANNSTGAGWDNALDLGAGGTRWKDLYLSGSISDGTNSKTVADIVSGGGKVLQVVENSGSNTFTSSASSWVTTPVTATITPLSSTSLIIGVATVANWRSSYGSYFGVRAVNSGGNTNQVMARGDGYISGANISWDTTYPFSYTAGSTSAITTTFQLHANSGPSWFPNNASTFAGETNFQRWHVRLMEIAQ